MNEYAVCQQLIATHKGVSAPDELVLFVEGENEYTGFPTVIMDEESAATVIAVFKDRGVEIPIDFEHSTANNSGKGEKAPAVGWIFDLHYKKGVGLIAKVNWNDGIGDMIESKQYKYHSPVAIINTETNKVKYIHSVALTNSPRTKKMNELLAATLSAEQESQDMAKKKKKADNVTLSLKGPREKLNKMFKVLTAEEVMPDVEVDTAELPEEQVEVLDEVGQKIEELKTVVVEAAEGTGEETTIEILDMAIALISGGGGEEADEDVAASKKLAATLCAKFGVSDMGKAIKKFDTLMVGSVPADDFKKVKDQLQELQGIEDNRNAEALVASFVETGQLNPNNKDKMAWALKCAVDGPDDFKTLMEDAPVHVAPGRLTKMDGSGKPKTERSKLVANLSSEFDDNPAKMGKTLTKKSYVNSCLQDEGESYLSDSELETLKISG